MIYAYAIKNFAKDFIYVGMTYDLDRRIQEHNKGYNTSTRPYSPFKLIYTKAFSDRKLARNHEKEMKSTTGRRKLNNL